MKQAVCVLIPCTLVPSWFTVVSRPQKEELWGMPGGKVDPGETPLQAAVREVHEEIGLDLHPSTLEVLHTSVCHGEVDYETTTFLYTGPDVDGVRYKVEEGLHAGLATEDELCDPKFSPFAEYNRRAFADLAKRKLKPASEQDDVYTIAEFRDVAGPHGNVWGSICPTDGSGYWATTEGFSYGHPVFANNKFSPQPHWATHVIWFNN
jgi:8-oxo-dGTP pyrophosphatase MutT (NUDIX family)